MTSVEEQREMECSHRLHYRWSQLEADRCGVNIGSPMRPLPTANRVLELDPNRMYEDNDWPLMSSECPEELAKFSKCAGVYKTIDYNTFSKNGCLKLSEIELYFLSSKLTQKNIHDWVLVYLGIGTGERFRWLRDEFFPGLAVIAFDPLDGNFSGDKEACAKAFDRWSNDGTNFSCLLRSFDVGKDSDWVLEKCKGKKILLISDIRGIAFLNGETSGDYFDKQADQDLQLQAIHRLRPERSLCKFACPQPWNQIYEYAPGVLLKQIFCYFQTREVRLMVDGVPEEKRKYNVWELYEKMMFHHEHLRGQVYKTDRRANSSRCLDCCFDCTVLWDTISSYAEKHERDAYEVLDLFVKFHVYSPSDDSLAYTWAPPTRKQRWDDVKEFLRTGKLSEAIAALQSEGEEDAEGTDWADITEGLSDEQPHVVKRLQLFLHRPARRDALVRALGSLSDPFTFMGSELSLLSEEDLSFLFPDMASAQEPPPKKQRTVWDNRFTELSEEQQKAATKLGWTEESWNANKFHLPRKTKWDALTEEIRQSLSDLGESAETWDDWRIR